MLCVEVTSAMRRLDLKADDVPSELEDFIDPHVGPDRQRRCGWLWPNPYPVLPWQTLGPAPAPLAGRYLGPQGRLGKLS